jgi:hypothetical protein
MLAGFGLRNGWLTRLTLTRFQRDDLPDAVIVGMHAGERVAETDADIEREVTVRIPLACCPGGSIAVSRSRTFDHERRYLDEGTLPPIPEEWLRTSWSSSDAVCAGSGGSSRTLGCGGTTSSGGRTLRGCAVTRPRTLAQIAGWLPIAAAAFAVLRRGRIRR